MPDEKKPLNPAHSTEPKKDVRGHPETNFLPPLDMVLTFFDRTFRKRNAQKDAAEEQKETDEKNVEKLIEKLSEKEEK